MVHSFQIPADIPQVYARGEALAGKQHAACLQAFLLRSEIAAEEKIKNVDLSCIQELDRDEEVLCAHCLLPMGDFGYNGIDGKGPRVHGECLAQQMQKHLQEEEFRRREQDISDKLARRTDYGIGWKMEHIPRNVSLRIKAKDLIPLQGMCCIVFEESSRSVRLVSTEDPSAAINLEYLSIALQVRRNDGREPFFSLDPIEGRSCDDIDFDKDCIQIKRFEPEWLAGTSVGEVMFQADYHLKELSMGECDQPVVGMKSCLDYSEEEYASRKWTAREWFMIRHAEVLLSEDNALIPVVKMGVEAREQVYSACGLTDAPLTRKSHPMVKYAESFSKNFDLIAERKSVIYHLRELAKASVLAKFLIDRNVTIEESWFNLMGKAEEASAVEVPQLWNERACSSIKVADGEILGASEGIKTHTHGVYGGVNLNLAQFDMSKIAPRRVVAVTLPARTGLLTGGAVERKYPTATLSLANVPRKPPAAYLSPAPAMLSGALGPEPSFPEPTFAASLSATGVAAPRGVDLCLSQFSMDAPLSSANRNCVTEPMPNALAAKAKTFWACVDNLQAGDFDKDTAEMFRLIYNPSLSDRRNEGDDFTPLDCSSQYVKRLQSLLADEEEIRKKRCDHFFSIDFSERSPGPLFPSSWVSQFAITNSNASVARGILQPCENSHVHAEVLKDSAPVFQRTTEDGTTFSIYRVGNVEIRTSQARDGMLVVGGVYSFRSSAHRVAEPIASWNDRVVKVSEYVEVAEGGGVANQGFVHKYFSVLQTDRGAKIVTEHTGHTVTWEENVVGLEDRISLAKVIRSADCSQSGAVVQDLANHRAKSLQQCNGDISGQNRSYATGVYVISMGGLQGVLDEVERRQKQWASCSSR